MAAQAAADRTIKIDTQYRAAMALEQGAKIHPQYKEEFDNSFSVDWQRIRYNGSGWAGIYMIHWNNN